MDTLVLIPTYNNIDKLAKLMSRISKRFDYLVINDGSTDETIHFLEKEKIKHINNDTNIGVSKSLLRGIDYAKETSYEYVISIDADLQHDPNFLDIFIDKIRDYDLVYGNRFSEISCIPSQKIGANLFASLLIWEFLNVFVPDVSCGFRGYRIDSIDRTCWDTSGFEFIYAVIINAIYQDQKIGYVNIEAIYYNQTLLCTRQQEIISLLNAITRFSSESKILTLQKSIINQEDLNIVIGGVQFYLFYIKEKAAYIIQVDIKEARRIYERNKVCI